MLEMARPNTILDWIQPALDPVLVNGELEFEISEILDSKLNNWRKLCKLLYLVCWMGYEGMEEETSWLLTTELAHALDLVMDFHSMYPKKPGPLQV